MAIRYAPTCRCATSAFASDSPARIVFLLYTLLKSVPILLLCLELGCRPSPGVHRDIGKIGFERLGNTRREKKNAHTPRSNEIVF